jgi:glutaconate CoA-transferase subunit A
MIVTHVVHEPWGCHPSFVQGYYDRDNDFYVAWEDISRDPKSYAKWLQEYVYEVPDRAAYMKKLGTPLSDRLRAKPRMSEGVDYGY